MKKFRNVMMVILDIVLVVVAIFFFAKVGVKDEEETNIKITSTTQENQDESLDIKSPDRIVFKNNEKYYVINSGDGNYNDLVEICVKNLSNTTPYDITESEIYDLKNTTNFVEFDYNTISKNYIFILDKDVSVVIRMKDSDGTVVADEIPNSDEIIKKFENEEIGKESYSFDKEEILANNFYEFLPSEYDFENIKNDKVYKKEFKSYSEYQSIISIYNLDFGENDVEEKFNNSKIILFLTKYDILDFKVNIGNIKINFGGRDYITYEHQDYIPILLIVSKAVNTNCIYYNYDNVLTIDNLTGKTEDVVGVIQSVNKDGTLNLGYTTDEYGIKTGILEQNDFTKDLEVGDYITGKGVIKDFSQNLKTYNLTEIEITKKDEYEEKIEKALKGKKVLSTSIIDYTIDEGNYEGYVICEVYSEEDSKEIGYVKIHFDFYEGNTESYLGTNHLQSDYGIVKYEMVTITLKDEITDLDNIEAKMFEYIAD